MIDSFTGRWFFLSNFYPIIIEYQGIKYPSVEHYYVAMKIKDDQMIDGRFVPFIDCREMLSKIPKAADVKRIGRSLKIRKDWDVIKLSIMEWGVREKFKDEKLSEMLLSTIGEEIVEGNFWNDTFWGVCNGKGQNNLGKILMMIREEIIEGRSSPSDKLSQKI